MSDLRKWEVEDNEFWNSTGKKIASRNLWISIPSLLCGFAVWLMWGIITVQMLNLGFRVFTDRTFYANVYCRSDRRHPEDSQHFLHPHRWRKKYDFLYHGVVDDTRLWRGHMRCRILTHHCGCFRSWLCCPALAAATLPPPMSNISFFYPKRVQGTSLGLNAGLGNFRCHYHADPGAAGDDHRNFWRRGDDPGEYQWHADRENSGRNRYLHSQRRVCMAGTFWFHLAFAGWFGMNNIVTETVTPHPGSPIAAFLKISGLLAIGFATAATSACICLLPAPTGIALLSKWIVLPLVIAATVPVDALSHYEANCSKT